MPTLPTGDQAETGATRPLAKGSGSIGCIRVSRAVTLCTTVGAKRRGLMNVKRISRQLSQRCLPNTTPRSRPSRQSLFGNKPRSYLAVLLLLLLHPW